MANHHPSFAGQYLKNYREQHGLTQEQFARDLGIEARSLRAYETGERQLNNINELRRMADLLGVDAAQLGAAALQVPRSAEEIEETLDHGWELIEQSRMTEARTVVETLAHHVRSQITGDDRPLLRSLARVYHSAGYMVSEATQARESYEAMLYYKEMETVSRLIQDHTLLNIALTYQGDMYRRLGDVTKAVRYLEAARDTTPQADLAARGNGIQLLARVYFKQGNLASFDRAMKEAEELSYQFDPGADNSTRGHYNAGTVYEDWGRAYSDLGNTNQAMDYLDKAEANLPTTPFWTLLMKTSRAIALVKGNDIQAGIALAIEASAESRAAGIGRFLDRMRSIDRYLEQKERALSNARRPLQDALYGDVDVDF